MAEDKPFEFIPRPEAQEMSWDLLLPPVKEAVAGLLLRLAGATKKVDSHVVSNCFLVTGDRGTGKTTVLLSAQKAVERKKPARRNWDFFDGATGDPQTASAKKSADELRIRHIHWLDPLDLEPLPRRANLLTTLLTRVHEALDEDDESPGHAGRTSLFEEREEGARQQLQRLISDATLMWEDIREADTRSKANRQVAAAGIYAEFRSKFTKALADLCGELDRRCGVETPPHIVLPIDNIDRSTDHLRSIIKLAQMVNCPHLWLVMAGDRVDLDTFLERAYWKELIEVGKGAGAIGKRGAQGEDEAFVMARRQAAAASQKLLPPSHRIEVLPVPPEETLRFCPARGCEPPPDSSETSREHSTIHDLLCKVKLDTNDETPRWFIQLLNTKEVPALKESPEYRNHDPLTVVAQHGLTLPARSVLDLWQVANAVNQKDEVKSEPFPAEKVARTMLRNVIASSKMSSDLGLRLQDSVLRRTVNRSTLLDFSAARPFIYRLVVTETQVRQNEPARGDDWEVQSSLSFNQIRDVVLSLGRSSRWSRTGASKAEEVPTLVTAWLAILLDIVKLSDESVVVEFQHELAPFVDPVHRVVRRVKSRDGWYHVAVDCPAVAQELRWPAPLWPTLMADDVFRRKWDWLRARLLPCDPSDTSVAPDVLLPRLAYGWLACALDTFAAVAPAPTHGFESVERLRADPLAKRMFEARSASEATREAASRSVMESCNALYEAIRPENSAFSQCTERTVFMREWLDQQLPLLLTYLYLPIADEKKFEEIYERWKAHAKDLVAAWRSHAGLILGDLNRSLAKLMPLEAEATVSPGEPQEGAREAQESTVMYRSWPSQFKTLHRFLSSSD